MDKERGRRRTVVGIVVSDKMTKTITVREDWLVQHGLYGKYVRRATTYKAHDEREEASPGDKVEIVSSRPLSRTKHWRLVRVLERATRPVVTGEDATKDVELPGGEEASS